MYGNREVSLDGANVTFSGAHCADWLRLKDRAEAADDMNSSAAAVDVASRIEIK